MVIVAKEGQWIKSSQGTPQEVVEGEEACFTIYQELL